MKNDIVNVDDPVQLPPSKRIKLEEDPSEEERLLSQKRHGKGGRRSKSTIEERALVLLNDDRISAVEPQQVLCRMCGHWVKLFKHIDFSPANWRTHSEKCEPRSGWRDRIRADPGAALTLTIPPLKPGHTVPAAEAASVPPKLDLSSSISSAPEVKASGQDDAMVDEDSNEPLEADAFPPRRITRTTADRRREVESDPRCENSGPHSVLCKMCGQWVRLHNTREYDLWNWLRHAEKCEVRNGWVTTSSGATQVSNSVSAALGGDFDASPDVSSTRKHSERAMDASCAEMLSNSQRTMTRALRRHLSTSQGSELETHRQLGRTIPSAVDIDRPGKLQPSRGRRVAEQRELSLQELEGTPSVHDESVSSNNMLKSTGSRTIPTIKTERDGSNEWLYHERGQKTLEGNTSASVSTSMKRRKGRSVEERRQALLNDPRISEVLPNEVFCSMCKKWIKLYKEVDYVESNWTRHAERCSLRIAAKHRSLAARPIFSAPLPSSSTSTPASPTKRSPVKSNEERLRDLQSDPRIEAVEPHQALCRICKQWIKLQSYRDYDIWNWRKHIPLCEQRHSDAAEGARKVHFTRQQQTPVPSKQKRSSRFIKAEEIEDKPPSASAVSDHLPAIPKVSFSVRLKDESSAEDRRAVLSQDGRCENIEPQRVTCKLCQRVVGLHLKKDYSLSNWYRHVASCDKAPEKVTNSALRTPLTAVEVSRPAATANEPSTSAQAILVAPTEDTKTSVDKVPLEPDTELQLAAFAPSHPSKSAKSTPADRRARLLADARVEAVDHNRIKCRLCQHWLKLNEFMEYAPYNWYKHIERCEIRTSVRGKGTSDEPIVVKEEERETPETIPETIEFVQPSISTDGGPRKRTTPAERLARMQADQRIKTIEKHRARCGLCDRWVKLQNKTEYDPHNWFAHVKKCAEKANPPVIENPPVLLPVEKKEPSPMVITDSDSERIGNPTVIGRRAFLLNDVRSAAVEPHRVLCGICNQWIKLRDGKEYVPYNWIKHKRKCEKRNGLPQTTVGPNEAGAVVSTMIKQESVSADLGFYNNEPHKITDEERETRLRADPRLGDVEPGRVFCKMCNNWIRLNMSTGFLPGNWMRHALRCKGRASWQGTTPDCRDNLPELSALEVIDLEIDNAGGHFGHIELAHLIGNFEPTVSSIDYGDPAEPRLSPTPAVTKQLSTTRNLPTLRVRTSSSRLNSPAPLGHTNSDQNVQDPGKRMHRSEEMRKRELEDDPRTKIVHPEKILCKMCDRWIQMRRDVSYSPQNWLKHAGICGQRTGWLKKHKMENETGTKAVVQSTTRVLPEDLIPYNARKRIEEQENDFEPPPLKPVDWGRIGGSEEDDDDDLTSTEDVSVSAAKVVAAAESDPSVSATDQETLSSNDVPNTSGGPKMSVPTPLAGLRANKTELKAHPISTPSASQVKIPTSTSPPIVLSPFTTVPLPFYRPPYRALHPHLMRPGYIPANKDGLPPKSTSPQNGGPQQRVLPFVVPAPSMLPHLLPRPALFPISRTSRQTSRTISPFPLSVTPPVLPVGMGSANRMSPVFPSAMPQTTGASNSLGNAYRYGSANSVPTSTSSVSAEAGGVAVPVPIKPTHGNGPITPIPNVDKATSLIDSESGIQQPSNGSPGIDGLWVSPTPFGMAQPGNEMSGSTAVLQLGPRVDLPLETEAVQHTNKAGSPLTDSASVKSVPDVLQLGPRMDPPGDKPKEKPKRDEAMPVRMAALKESGPERLIPPGKPGPGVLQLAPGTDALRWRERERQSKEKGKEVRQLAPDINNSRERMKDEIVVVQERLDVPGEDDPMAAEPPQDTMLVKA